MPLPLIVVDIRMLSHRAGVDLTAREFVQSIDIRYKARSGCP